MAKEGVVNIHGKEYVTVAKRVQHFREHNPNVSIITDVIKIDDEQVLIKASIITPSGQIMATGHGHEVRSASQINKTSYVENAETSAIGRALACLGMGGTEFASANEVQNAIHQQNNPVGRAAAALKPKEEVKAPENVTPNAGAWEAMDEESQIFLTDLAMQVVDDLAMDKLKDAHDKLQGLDNEEKAAIWTRFDSKTRSKLKAYNDSLKG
jgi:hypothetical protein